MSLIHSSKWWVHVVTSNDLHTTPIFIVLHCLKLGRSNLRRMSCKSQMEMWWCWGQQQVSWASSSGLLQRWVSSWTHVVRVLHAIQKLETGENKQQEILHTVDIRRTRCTLYVWSCWKLCELKTTVWETHLWQTWNLACIAHLGFNVVEKFFVGFEAPEQTFFVLHSFLFHETAAQDDDGTDDGPDAVAHNWSCYTHNKFRRYIVKT